MARNIKPNEYPEWAKEDIRSGKYNEWNTLEPFDVHKNQGYRTFEPFNRQFENWKARRTYQWIEYLDTTQNWLEEYAKLDLPPAVDNKGKMVFVTDVDGGAIAVSNGIKWKKISLTTDI